MDYAWTYHRPAYQEDLVSDSPSCNLVLHSEYCPHPTFLSSSSCTFREKHSLQTLFVYSMCALSADFSRLQLQKTSTQPHSLPALSASTLQLFHLPAEIVLPRKPISLRRCLFAAACHGQSRLHACRCMHVHTQVHQQASQHTDHLKTEVTLFLASSQFSAPVVLVL